MPHLNKFKTKVNMKNKTSILVGTRHFFFALLATVFCSCGGSTDKDLCLKSVKTKFPNAKVYAVFEGSCTEFVVIDSINVYSVKTLNLSNPNISEIKVLERK